MSKLQAALRSGTETLESLTSKFYIKVKRHGTYPSLAMCKYDQINSPMAEPLVQECRGIIFDEADNWRIVARPFDKFFNVQEPLAATIDWATARVQEKLDGSLAIVFFYDQKWNMATSGTPDASGPVGDHGMTFKELFWKVWKECEYDQKSWLDPKWTYMFELCTPFNRVVVSHPKNRLVLLGIRHTENGNEANIDIDHELHLDFDVVKSFAHKSLEELTSSFEVTDGLEQEGYVVVDAQFRRVKVKHPRYILFHQMLGSLTQKKLLEVIRTGEVPEVLGAFPEWKNEAETLERRYKALIMDAEGSYESIRDIPVQKDFAKEALKTRFSSAMFTVRAGKAKDFKEFFRTLRIEALSDMLGLKEETTNEQVQVQG